MAEVRVWVSIYKGLWGLNLMFVDRMVYMVLVMYSACALETKLIGFNYLADLSLYSVDTTTGAYTIMPKGFLSGYLSIASDPLGNFFLVGDSGGISKLDVGSGTLTRLTTAIWAKMMDIAPDSTFALVYDGSYLYRFDTSSYALTSLMGHPAYTGVVNGVGMDASVPRVSDMRIAPDQTFAILSDQYNNCIRKYVFATNSISTLAGVCSSTTGNTDGTGTVARFNGPLGLDISQDGTYMFVADASNMQLRKVMTSDGTTSTLFWIGCVPMSLRFSPDYSKFYHSCDPFSGSYQLLSVTVSTLARSTVFQSPGAPNFLRLAFVYPLKCVAGSTYSISGLAPCTACSSCTAGTRRTGVCTITNNTVCSPCDTCASGYGKVMDCTTTNNTVCAPMCNAGLTYSSTGLVPCTACPLCAAGLTYEAVPCNTTSPPVCVPINMDCQMVLIGQYGGLVSKVSPYGKVEVLSSGLVYAYSTAIVTNGTVAIMGTTAAMFVIDLLTNQVRQVSTTFYGAVATFNATHVLAHNIDSRWIEFFNTVTLKGGGAFVGWYDQPLGTVVDGVGTAARVPYATDLIVSPDRKIALIMDGTNCILRMINMTTASVTTLAGTLGSCGSTVDGVGTNAAFTYPRGVAISQDSSYALVVDSYFVRKVVLSSGAVSTIVGCKLCGSGFVDGVGTAAQFRQPLAVRFAADFSYALVIDNGYVRSVNIQTLAVKTLTSYLSASAYGLAIAATPVCPAPCVAGVAYSGTGISPCTACSTCAATSYVSGACTATSNTVCSACSSCVLGSTYQMTACTATSNTVCSACSSCVLGSTYQTTACGGTTNTVCSTCTACAAGSYASTACTTSTDAVCSLCKSCTGSTYMASACTPLSDTVCTQCSTCPAGISYMTRSCTNTSDTQCTPCTVCAPGYYSSTPCTPTSNTVCSPCSTCTNGLSYLQHGGSCTPTSNTVCQTCTACTLGSTFAAIPCGTDMDTVCLPCAVCPAGGTQCTLTSNTVCTPPEPALDVLLFFQSWLYQYVPGVGVSVAARTDVGSVSTDLVSTNVLVGGGASMNYMSREFTFTPQTQQPACIMPDASFAVVYDRQTDIMYRHNLTTNNRTLLVGGDLYDLNGEKYGQMFYGLADMHVAPNGRFMLMTETNAMYIWRFTFATNTLDRVAGGGNRGSTVGYEDGMGADARFDWRWGGGGITISRDSTFALVADRNNNVVRKLVFNSVSVYAWNTWTYVYTPVVSTLVSIELPNVIQLSPDNTYAVVSDPNGNVRAINMTTLAVSTFATQSANVWGLAFLRLNPRTPCGEERYSATGFEPCLLCDGGCSWGWWESTQCTNATNRVCSRCTVCDPSVGRQYVATCGATSDAVCSSCPDRLSYTNTWFIAVLAGKTSAEAGVYWAPVSGCSSGIMTCDPNAPASIYPLTMLTPKYFRVQSNGTAPIMVLFHVKLENGGTGLYMVANQSYGMVLGVYPSQATQNMNEVAPKSILQTSPTQSIGFEMYPAEFDLWCYGGAGGAIVTWSQTPPCVDGTNFSTSGFSPCTPCTRCVPGVNYSSVLCTALSDTGVCIPCTRCTVGYYKAGGCDGFRDTVCALCKTCAFGYFKTGGCYGEQDTTCELCPANHWCVNGTATACPAPSVSPVGSTSSSSCTCPAGTLGIVDAVSAHCTQCPVGGFCPGTACTCL